MKNVSGVCRVLTSDGDVYVAHHECTGKKPFGNRFRVSRSESIIKSDGLLPNNLRLFLSLTQEKNVWELVKGKWLKIERF